MTSTAATILKMFSEGLSTPHPDRIINGIGGVNLNELASKIEMEFGVEVPPDAIGKLSTSKLARYVDRFRAAGRTKV